jgi:putative RNA 2'-phosphotransferase
MSDLVRLSKFLAVLLRHEPEKFGLVLDEAGYADTDLVWKQVHEQFPGRYTYQDLLKVVEGDQDGKKRYEIHGRRIRALFGHSVAQKIRYPSVTPPETLYHGTVRDALDGIREDGLKAQHRQYVHLAVGIERAAKVAQRHGARTIILRVRAGEAHRAGVAFYNPEPEHFLAETIPPVYIEFPDD